MKQVKNKVVYMEVTTDRLALPLAVADNRNELARMRGVSPDVISSNISKVKHGKRKKTRFLRVEIEVDEGEEW